MLGRRISIDKDKCDGCGLCVKACHEGAIELIDGKAELVRENVCDGLGDCLPACPQDAITFMDPEPPANTACIPVVGLNQSAHAASGSGCQWPIQIALVPPKSDFFKGTLLIGADCTAFVVDDFKSRFGKGNPVVIGCPKLDDRSRFDKIQAILTNNPIEHVTVVRMEVPCCSALTKIVLSAVENCGRDVEVSETIISRDGSIVQQA